MKFRAAVLHERGQPLAIETVEIGGLQPGDVLVRMRAAGLCHTDLEVIDGSLSFPMPIVLGHEAAGIVERVADDVTTVKPGDHVVLSWNPHCGHCFYCDHGMPILCETYVAMGAKGVGFDGRPRLELDGRTLHHLMFIGGFAEYSVAPAQCVIKVPDAIPFDRACVIGCGVMTGFGAATRVAPVQYGASVIVIGCGAVGLNAIQGARLSGAARIVAVDLDARRLAAARAVGATDAVAPDDKLVATIRGMTAGRGADYVFEAAGNERVFALATEMVRPGGKVVFLGKVNVDRQVAFRWGSLMGEKQILRSSYGGARPQQDFPRLAQAYLDGALKLDELVTTRIRLDQINDGFARMRRGEDLRIVVELPGG